MQKVLNAIQRVRFTKSTLRHASIRDNKGPSLGKMQVKPRHQRSPHATKFEDRSHEETERQERCAQSKGWYFAKNLYKLKANDKATFFSPTEKWVLPSAPAREPEEREFCGWFWCYCAHGHLLSWRPWGHQGVRRRWWRPTARCEQIKKRRCLSDNWTYSSLSCFVNKLPQCFHWENSAIGYTYHWKSCQNPHLIRDGKRIVCTISNCVPFVAPGISASSSSTAPSSASSPSSSQESTSENRDSVSENRHVEAPVSERNGGMNEELRREPLHDSTETENKIKTGNRKRYKEIHRMNRLIGYRNSGRIWLMKVLLKSFGETWCRGVQTLPVRLMNLQWSREQKWNRFLVSTVCSRTSRKTQIVKYAWRRK